MHDKRIWRESIGATLADVAKIIGVDPSLISYWELGKRNVSPQLLAAWRDALRELEAVALKRREEARHG
jgi:transcriptional regulator with XRE-family HTH domain